MDYVVAAGLGLLAVTFAALNAGQTRRAVRVAERSDQQFEEMRKVADEALKQRDSLLARLNETTVSLEKTTADLRWANEQISRRWDSGQRPK